MIEKKDTKRKVSIASFLNFVWTVVSTIFSLAFICGIIYFFINLVIYALPGIRETSSTDPSTDIGGGIYIGAYESSLSSRYNFGGKDYTQANTSYETSEFTKVFGKRFDHASILFANSYVSGIPSIYGNTKHNGRVDVIKLEVSGSRKEMRDFMMQLIRNIRNEVGLPKDYNFHRRYSLSSPKYYVSVRFNAPWFDNAKWCVRVEIRAKR